MSEIKDMKGKEHKLSLVGREKLTISGVDDVGSFDDNTVIVSTQLGDLVIKGNNLHIKSLDINEGNLVLHGLVYSCIYTENTSHKREKGFFKSIFK